LTGITDEIAKQDGSKERDACMRRITGLVVQETIKGSLDLVDVED